MVNRKTKIVRLEIYEDKVELFKGFLWLLKDSLNDFNVYMFRKNHKDPLMFDAYTKEYLDFMWSLVNMVYIPSIDGENAICPKLHPYTPGDWTDPEDSTKTILDHLYGPKKANLEDLTSIKPRKEDEEGDAELEDAVEQKTEKRKKEPYEDETREFITQSKTLQKIFPKERLEELIASTNEFIRSHQIKILRKDEFFDAAHALCRLGWSVTTVMDRLLDNLFRFRFFENEILQDNPLHSPRDLYVWEKYQLAGRFFDYTRFHFREFRKMEYQLEMMTGYVMSQLGLLKKEDEFYLESQGVKTWPEYLAQRGKYWKNKAYELGFEIDADEEE